MRLVVAMVPQKMRAAEESHMMPRFVDDSELRVCFGLSETSPDEAEPYSRFSKQGSAYWQA